MAQQQDVIDRQTEEGDEFHAHDGAIVMSPTDKATVDMQVATAKRYPRSVKRALDEAKSMAGKTEDIAASCCYSLPRKGKAIKGPTIRLAEIMAACWGNIRAESRVLQADAKHVEAEAVCWDLEKNYASRVTVKRRITNADGYRYNDDMIATTGMAAASIAYRNAVIRVIPRSYVHEVYDHAQATALGDIKTLAERRTKAVEFWTRFGITLEQVLQRLERDSLENVTLDDVATLRSLAESVKRGDLSVEQAFPGPEAEPAKPRTGASGIADSVEQQMDEVLNRGKPAAGAPGSTEEQLKAAGEIAAAAPRSPTEQARRQQIEEMAGKKREPCAKGKPGCSDDITGGVCTNHAPGAGAAAPAADPNQPAEGQGSLLGGDTSPDRRRSKRT